MGNILESGESIRRKVKNFYEICVLKHAVDSNLI